MNFNEAFNSIASCLKKINISIKLDDYDGLILKQLKSSNTLDEGRSTNQTHIAITGEQMEIFPCMLRSSAYFDSDSNKYKDLKKYFLLQYPVNLYKNNIAFLNGNTSSFINDTIKVYASILSSKREIGDNQIQLSIINSDDNAFVDFRRLLHTDYYLVLLKKYQKFEYDAFGLTDEIVDDANTFKELNNNFYYRVSSFSRANISTLIKTDKDIADLQNNGDKITSGISHVFYNNLYRTYITAIKSKPFLLLAGISGTGKSRIVRELARACWNEGTSEYKALKPSNFEMIQVKPNWHDSSELIGYLSNLNGTRYIAGDFLKFVVKAWAHEDTPYFLCLDEMNLAPVEQYFAEYLSVIESRKYDENSKKITTDEIIKPVYSSDRDKETNELKLKEWYSELVAELLADCPDDKKFALKTQFEDKGISIPQNLIVVGTVNMDETTFSFSRKVLDRAMTIEMNEFNLYGGLTEKHENIGKLGKQELIADAVEGSDVYSSNKEVCDKVLEYLKVLNEKLEGTPFKVAYRTRNEMLLYVINNLPYNLDNEGKEIPREEIIAVALDEITNMKILSRIEGDGSKFGNNLLNNLSNTIKLELNKISGKEYSGNKHNPPDSGVIYSVSMGKLSEMQKRLDVGYTSFWN